MQGARASLDDLAVRWETPKGREVKNAVIADLNNNSGRGLDRILSGFIYTDEVLNKTDLRCITLEDVNLNESTWEDVDLSWSSFKNSSLGRISLHRCTVKRSSFEGCQLNLAKFKKCELSRVDFSNANLEHANFQDSKLTGSRFIGSDLARASFEGANLSKCNFLGARLEQVNFNNANCQSANFSDGALTNVAAKPEKVDDVRFEQQLTDFENEVGLKSLAFRSTRVFKGLEALVKMNAMLDAAKAKASGNASPSSASPAVTNANARPEGVPPPAELSQEKSDKMLFGAPIRTRKLDRANIAPPENRNFQTTVEADPSPASPPRQDEQTMPYGQASPASADYYGSSSAPPPADAYGAAYGKPGTSDDNFDTWSQNAPPADAYSSGPATPTPIPPASAARKPTDSARITRNFYGNGSAPTPIPPAQPKMPTRQFQKTPPPPTRGGPRTGRVQSPVSTGRFRRAPSNAPRRPGSPPTGAPVGPKPQGPGPRSSGVMRNTQRLPPRPDQRRPNESGLIRRPTESGVLRRGGSNPNIGPVAQTGRRPLNTRRMPRSNSPSGILKPPFDLAPPKPDAPEITEDWATAIGQLMAAKSQITKIVIETGDSSRIVFRRGNN